jgi:transcription initiation factor TFIIA small subunit
MSAIYRGCHLGDALVEALDVLVTEGKIDGPLAGRVMEAYDEVMAETLEKKVTGKGTLKGKLDVYRYIDNIWTFVVSKASLRSASHQSVPKKDEQEEDVEGTVKLTVVDAKLLKLTKK